MSDAAIEYAPLPPDPVTHHELVLEMERRISRLKEAAHAVLLDTCYVPGDRKASRVSAAALTKLHEALNA